MGQWMNRTDKRLNNVVCINWIKTLSLTLYSWETYPVDTQVYIISQLAVKSPAVLWDATGRSALVSPHATECKYLQACLSVSKKKLRVKLNCWTIKNIVQQLSLTLDSWLLFSKQICPPLVHFCAQGFVLKCQFLRRIRVSGGLEASQGRNVLPLNWFALSEPICLQVYLSVCEECCPEGWKHLLCFILLFCDGGVHALRYRMRGDNWIHSDSSIKHKKWLLALSDAAGFTQSDTCKGALLFPANIEVRKKSKS